MRVGHLVGWTVLLWPAVGLAAGPDEQLMEAVRGGDTAVVRALVEQGVDVTTPEGDGATALHWAAYADDAETAELLIRAGAGVDATNDLGVTPLWVACTNGSAEMVARLLEADANPNIAPATGGTPLMRAVRTGNADAVELLLTAGADVNAREGSRGQNALMWAVTQRHATVARMLIERGADLEARTSVSRQLVLTCCQENNTDGNGSIWIEQGGFTPLLFAARLGDLDAARLLLAAGAHVDVATPGGTTALVVAAPQRPRRPRRPAAGERCGPERRRRRLHGPARGGPARRSGPRRGAPGSRSESERPSPERQSRPARPRQTSPSTSTGSGPRRCGWRQASTGPLWYTP